MGIKNLWSIIESSGRNVSIEYLRGQRLAVDISIWLNQIVRAMRTKSGETIPNAHIYITVFRLCKLLYYGIKPVIVFDGSAPALKKRTLAKRREKAKKAENKMDQLREEILASTVVEHLKSNELPPQKNITDVKLSSDEEEDTDIIEQNEMELETLYNKQIRDNEIIYVDLPYKDEVLHIAVNTPQLLTVPSHLRPRVIGLLKAQLQNRTMKILNSVAEDAEEMSMMQMRANQFRLKVMDEVYDILSNEEKEKNENKQTVERNGYEYYYHENSNPFDEEEMNDLIQEEEKEEKQVIADDIFIKQDNSLDQFEMKRQRMNDEFFQSLNQWEIGNVSDKKEEKEKDEGKVMLYTNLGELMDNRDLSVQSYEGGIERVHFTSKENEVSFVTMMEKAKEEKEMEVEKEEVKDINPYEEYERYCEKMERGRKRRRDEMKEMKEMKEVKEVKEEEMKEMKEVKEMKEEEETTEEEMKEVKEVKEMKEEETTEEEMKEVKEVKEMNEEETTEEEADDLIIEVNDNGDLFVDCEERKEEVINTTKREREENENENEKELLQINKEIWKLQKHLKKLYFRLRQIENEMVGKEEREEKEEEEEKEEKEEEDKKKIMEEEDDDDEDDDNDIIEEASIQQTSNTSSHIQEEATKLISLSLPQLQQYKQSLFQQYQHYSSQNAYVTEDIILDILQILQIFGIPYLFAPGEAEAQCSYLEMMGLVDGIISNDSDIFAFGGKTVYKDFFVDNHYIQEYRSNDIEKEKGLTRERIIEFALLHGSDYCDGIPDVGKITAVELISFFPSLIALRELPNEIKKDEWKEYRKKLEKYVFPEGFVDSNVINAYMFPAVDSSLDAFEWNEYDEEKMKVFLKNHPSVNESRLRNSIQPALKNQKKETQLLISDLLTYSKKSMVKKEKSKRLQAAFKRLVKLYMCLLQTVTKVIRLKVWFLQYQ